MKIEMMTGASSIKYSSLFLQYCINHFVFIQTNDFDMLMQKKKKEKKQ